MFVAYADCGTGGHLDALLEQHPGIERLPGAHCYEVFAGAEQFAELHDTEPGTFFLTDFLARHFDALVWEGLGLDRHPELLAMYFGNYTRVVLLSHRPATTWSPPVSGPPIASACASSTATSVGTPGRRRAGDRAGGPLTPRRSATGEVVVILWRDIPAQVNGELGRSVTRCCRRRSSTGVSNGPTARRKIHTARRGYRRVALR